MSYQLGEWLPIESAPKDRPILLFRPDWPYRSDDGDSRISVGFYESDRYAKNPRPYWASDCAQVFGVRAYRASNPTHWMPLPAAPDKDAKS